MKPEIIINRDSSLIIEKNVLCVNNLKPKQKVKICAEAIDHAKRLWTSYGVFESDEYGVVDLSKMVPLEGTYSECRADGLIYSMSMQKDYEKNNSEAVIASHVFAITGINPLVITYKIFDNGELLAEKSLNLEFINQKIETIEINEPIKGKYFCPKDGNNLSALLVFGGSSGGFLWGEQVAAVLASRGYSTLALSYFDYMGTDGLPQTLTEIPIEYFKDAIDWLKSQSEVRNDKLGVIGISKGGEASLLLGSIYNQDINALVSFVPSSHVFESCTMGSINSMSSWTYNGNPVSFINYPAGTVWSMDMDPREIRPVHERALKEASLQMLQDARIHVEKCRCPILMITGGLDFTWPSTEMTEEIIKTLEKAEYPYEYKHLFFPDSGHPFFLPNIPPYIDNPDADPKGFAKANQEAWDHMLKFLNNNL